MRLSVPAAVAPAVCDALAEALPAVARDEPPPGEPAHIEAFATRRPDVAALSVRLALLSAALGFREPEIRLDPVPPVDWAAAAYESFPPLRIGRWFIRGAHYGRAVPAGAIGLRVDAATAFGTGEHPTTAGCLLALQRLPPRRVDRALDMGCGTGILAFAMARLWPAAHVLAVDLDPEAVRVARRNARANALHRRVCALLGGGYGPAVRRQGPYDLVVANILARPLIALAPPLARNLAPGGRAVLSGLLHGQARAVLAAHRRQGLVLRAHTRIGAWTTLVVAKRACGR